MFGIQGYTNGTTSTPFSEKLRLIRFRMSKEQPRFSQEIKLIPLGLVYVLVGLFISAQVGIQLAKKYGGGEFTWREFSPAVNHLFGALGVTGLSIPLVALTLLVGYVNRDAKRRGMNSTLWTLLVIILMPAYLATGFIIYFLLREPLSYACPQCHATVSARFNYCPDCKFNLRPSCPQCRREVRVSDRFCPHCAQELATGKNEV